MKVDFIQNIPFAKHSDNSVKQVLEVNDFKTNNKTSKLPELDANGYYNKIAFQGTINKNNNNIRHKLDNYQGCLIGGAIGDALGAPVEFMPLYEIKKTYGSEGINKFLIKKNKKAEFTDDTQMTIFTADGLIKSALKNHSINNINFYDVFESYGDWLSTQRNLYRHKGWLSDVKELYKVKAPGNTCISAIMGGEPGTLDKKINDSKGNGGTMRVAPVGLMYYNNPSRAFNVAVGCCALTHSRPEAYLSAGAMASIIAYIIKGESLQDAVEKTIKILERKSNNEKVTSLLKTAVRYSKKNMPTEDVIPQLGNGWTGEEALAIAVYSALKYPDNFKKAVECSVNITGDSDTVGSITGNIMGAYLGAKKIPAEYKKKINMADVLSNLAQDLYVMPNRIKNKNQKYPVSQNNKENLSLKSILGENYKATKPVANKELKKILKSIPNVNIKNYQDFLSGKDLSINSVMQIIEPIEMILAESKDKAYFDKMMYALTQNIDNLTEKENKRGLWYEDRVQLPEFLWQIYGLILNNKNISEEIFKTVTVMTKSGNYSLKDMSDLLTVIGKRDVDFMMVNNAICSGKTVDEVINTIL